MSNIQRIRYADSTALSAGTHFTRDSMMTYDNVSQYTIDSTGAFLIGELERLDQTAHPPLVNVTWPRDIDLREDVQMGDEVSSYTLQTFAAPGGVNPSGINWISKEANAIPGISLDIGKVTNPLNLWGMEMKFTLPELASAARLGRPIDTQMYDGIMLKHQMDIDQCVYIGATEFSRYGLFNSPLVTPTNAAAVGAQNGATNSPLWLNKTPQQMLNDVNTMLMASYAATGYSRIPDQLRLPPNQWSYLANTIVSTAGNSSVLTYLSNNSVSNAMNGRPLNILPVKWLVGRGAGGTDRMVAYTKDRNFVRFPMVGMQRTPVEYRSIWQMTTYYCRLGTVELVYPEVMAYVDGI